MTVTATNTQNNVVVNSNNTEQHSNFSINAEIITVSRALLNSVINSSKKQIEADEIVSCIPLYAVLDYCVRYLKTETLSDAEKKELEEIISHLNFKMPCNANLADRCNGVFAKFYGNPLHQPTESLPEFFDVIQILKNSNEDKLVLLVIRLYILLLYKKGDAPENIAKVLTITQDVLSGFQAYPFLVAQNWYTSYFDYHLGLLGYYLKAPLMQSESNQAEQIKQIINLIDEKLILHPNSSFLLMQKAFLLSRPEWFTDFLPFGAISCLNKIENKTNGTQLQILYLKYEQILRSFYPHQDLNKERLMPIVKDLIKLKTDPAITPSDYILASCLIATIQIQFAKLDNNPKSLRSALNLMEEVSNKYEDSQTPLSRFAESHALKCKIEWVIYCIFAGETKDYKKALIELEKWQELPPQHPLNKISSEIKDCLLNAKSDRLGLAFTAKTISFIERFKWLIQGDFQAFYYSNRYYNAHNNIIIKEGDGEAKDQQKLWSLCKSKVIDMLQTQSIEEMENLLKQIFRSSFKGSCNTWKELFSSISLPFTTSNPTQLHLIQINDGDNGLYVDVRKIDEFMHQCPSHPGLPTIAFQQIFKLFKMGEFFIRTETKETYSEIKLSSIEIVNCLLSRFIQRIRTFGGQPIYTVVIQELHRELIVQMRTNAFLQQILSGNQREMKHKTNKLALLHREHLNSLVATADLFYNIYIYYFKFTLSNDVLYFKLFKHAVIANSMASSASESDRNARYYLATDLMRMYDLYYKTVKEFEPPFEHPDVLKLRAILAKIMWINALPDEKEWHREATSFFNAIPAAIPDLMRYYQLKEPLSKEEERLLYFILLFKPFFLVQEQRIEEALKLQSELQNCCSLDKSLQPINMRNINFKLVLHDSNGKEIRPNLSRLNKNNYLQITNIELPTTQNDKGEKSEPSPEPMSQPHIPNFTKKEIREENLAKLERESEKKNKKRDRVAKVNKPQETSSSAVPNVSTSTVSSQPTPKRVISKKAYAIFETLFTQNNAAKKGPWENCSYRSDVTISRKEALKVIRALGGDYSESRGKGSHSLAHLSKLELNGVEIGICDFEEGEVLICFTKAADLKFYQLSQLRDALIKLGYTPDTVISEQEG